MPPITILSSSDVNHLLSLPATLPLALESQKALFLAFADSHPTIQSPLRISTSTDAHLTLYMPSRSPLGSGIKIASAPTSAHSPPGLPASTVILDESTGKVSGLINATSLTAIRNACSSALFLQNTPFPRGPPKTLTIFGSGLQSLTHAKVFLTLFPSINVITVIARKETPRLAEMIQELIKDTEGKEVIVQWGLAGTLDEQESPDKAQEAQEDIPSQPAPPEEDYLPEDGGVESDREAPRVPEQTQAIEMPASDGQESATVNPPDLSESWTSAEESHADAEGETEGFEMVDSMQSPVPVPQSDLPAEEAVDEPPMQFEEIDPVPVIEEEIAAQAPAALPTIPNQLKPINLPQILHNTHILFAATPSRSALFNHVHLTSQTHVILIGSYTPEMQEVQPELIRRAGVVVCDTVEGVCVESGDLIKAGWGADACVELGELVNEEKGPKVVERIQERGDVFLYKSVGVGIQDVAIAKLILEQAQIHGLGTKVQFD